MLRVEVSQQGHPSQTYHFQKHRVEVGRGANCDLVLTAPGISTIHAHIVFKEGRCLVIDQNSTNGTYLHGAPIHGPTKVQPYEAVYICSYCLHIEAIEEQALPSVQEPSEPPLLAPAPAPAPKEPIRPTVPELQAKKPSPAPEPVQPSTQSGTLGQTAESNRKQADTLGQATLPPSSEDPSSGKGSAQRITVQASPASKASNSQDSSIELRRWAIPAAPKHSSQDQQGLARVFAALAQPFIESDTLPKGDEKSRASFYALAQAQLSVNLSPQSSQLGQGAERVVQALCGIGPLSEVLRSGLLDKVGAELVAKPFEPLRLRNHSSQEDWQLQESTSLHPWAIDFAAARLLGLPRPPKESRLHQRLSNGLRLSFICAQDLQCGPMLMLHAPLAPAKSWEHYCSTHAVEAHTKALLEEAVKQGCPITIIEADPGPENLWNALQSYALEHSSLCHIGWRKDASCCPRAFNFCADESPSEQARMCQEAQSLALAPILAIDHPSQACLQRISRDPNTRAFWIRHLASSFDEDPVLAAMQALLKLQPKAAAGLCVLVSACGTSKCSQIEQIQEFSALPDQPIQEELLLTRQDNRLLPKAPHSGSFKSKAAQRSFSIAPDL